MLKKTRTVLFVCYGGGHGRMLLPLVQYINKNFHQLECKIFALTTAKQLFESNGIHCIGFSDLIQKYFSKEKAVIEEFGNKLFESLENEHSLIEKQESIAYLGLSYYELVEDFGKEKAEKLFNNEGRQAFLPLRTMKALLDFVNPSLVVTTNSPRAEKAAQIVAKELCIPSFLIVDLLGVYESYKFNSTYISVLCEFTKSNLEKSGVLADKIFVMGNPNFDEAFSYVEGNKLSLDSRSKQVILWIDQPAYIIDIKNKKLHFRTEKEIIADLNLIYSYVKENKAILRIRPHPSQGEKFFIDWLRSNDSDLVSMSETNDPYEDISLADIVVGYTSTMLLQAAFFKKKVIQINRQRVDSDFPLGRLGVAVEAITNQDLLQKLEKCMSKEDDYLHEKRMRKCKELFPSVPATPCLSNLIASICIDKRINEKSVLLIGTGSIGKRHLRNIKKLLGDQQKFIFVRENKREDELSKKYNAKVVKSIDEINSKEIYFAVIATPSSLHIDSLEKLIKKSIPIYVEKPLVTTKEDLYKLEKLVKENKYKGPVVVGTQLRYLPILQKVRKFIHAKKLGNLVRASFEVGQWLPDWRIGVDYKQNYSAKKEMGGGVVLDLIHEIDMAKWLFGDFSLVKSLYAKKSCLDIETEDVSCILMSSCNEETQPIVCIQQDYVSRKPIRKYTFVGDRGSLTVDLVSCLIKLTNEDSFEFEKEDFNQESAYVFAMQDMISCCLQKNNSGSSLEDSIVVMKLALRAKSECNLLREI